VKKRNLFLVPYVDHGIAAGLAEVARHAEEEAPDVRARVVHDRPHRLRRLAWAARPSLFFAPFAPRKLRPLRGTVLRCRSIPKTGQYEALERAGVPVPRWAPLRRDLDAKLEGFGPYVVVKPDLGRRGAHVKIKRRGRVRWRPIESPLRPGNTDLVVQEFVYTGRWPVCYRVTTLFGEVLSALRAEGSHAQPPLEGRFAFHESGGRSICAHARGCLWSFTEDPEVLATARRAHEAFADVPVLGVDLVRDVETGRVQVLEVNPGGATWNFHSGFAEALQREFGLDLVAQFDALRRTASLLVARTRRDAR
jgi:hypothetical protein